MSSLSPLAQHLAKTVNSHPKVRVDLAALRRAAAAADVSSVADVRARGRLAAAIDELVAAELVTVPAGKSGWDRLAEPPLPVWVAKVRARRARIAPPGAVAWHAELAWVPQLEGERPLNDEERGLLLATNELLAHGHRDVAVPVRERSLRLLGDEKALERWRRSRLFGPGRLSYELLSCYPCHPPVEQVSFDDEGPWLIVENWTTFRSIAESAQGLGRVLFGGGNQLATRLTGLAEQAEQPPALLYFGDLDVAGLRIPLAAREHAATLGLPALQPAVALYELLVTVGVPSVVQNRPSGQLLTAVRSWLGPEAGARVGQVLSGGHRLAQEAVGVVELARFDWADLR